VRDLERGVTTGRFDVDPRGLAPYSIGAIAQAALRARLEGAAPELAHEAAEQVLRLVGVPARDAREIASRPLPPLDDEHAPLAASVR
jgi:hypothetical protein